METLDDLRIKIDESNNLQIRILTFSIIQTGNDYLFETDNVNAASSSIEVFHDDATFPIEIRTVIFDQLRQKTYERDVRNKEVCEVALTRLFPIQLFYAGQYTISPHVSGHTDQPSTGANEVRFICSGSIIYMIHTWGAYGGDPANPRTEEQTTHHKFTDAIINEDIIDDVSNDLRTTLMIKDKHHKALIIQLKRDWKGIVSEPDTDELPPPQSLAFQQNLAWKQNLAIQQQLMGENRLERKPTPKRPERDYKQLFVECQKQLKLALNHIPSASEAPPPEGAG